MLRKLQNLRTFAVCSMVGVAVVGVVEVVVVVVVDHWWWRWRCGR